MGTNDKPLMIFFTRQWHKRSLARAIRGKQRPDFISPQRWLAMQRGRVREIEFEQLASLTHYLGLGLRDLFPEVH